MMRKLLSAFLTGAGTWTLAEHVLHQNLGHRFTKWKNPFTTEHLKHHATVRYFAPASAKAAAAVAVTAFMSPVARRVVGPQRGLAYTLGFVSAYLTYEYIHRRIHTHPPTGPYTRFVRMHHYDHHFRNPRMNHGVTSPLWDVVFKTYQPVERVRVPARQAAAIPWLLDPETGDVRAELARDYELARRGKRKKAPSVAATPASA